MTNDIIDNKNLLVIDDEIEITKSIYRQFRKKYKVYTATNGQEALALMEKEPIQVVLSDQRMPGMTGVDFFSNIKDKYPNALKLILTGYSDIEAVVGAINEGQVFRYLTKPWNPADLELAVKEAFDKHELITSNQRLMKQLHDANISLEEKVNERTVELENANKRLKYLNIEKNKTIGIVTHDLRNPIGGAYSFSDILISDYYDLSKEQHIEFLKIINERCSYSLNLIENFLDATKIESGILDLDFKKWNYCELIKNSITQNTFFSNKKNQKIHFECALEKPFVFCDKNKMEQVFANLISNAIKYSPENKNIWIEIEKQDKQLVTKVIDEGQGIPENELELVFNAYHTTSAKSTGGEKSTGLGLAIVKKIVKAHGGNIYVESQVNKGSTFYFTLPYE